MLSIDVKLSVINKYFVDGKGYKRIADLEMQVELLRNFLILGKGR